MSIKIKQQKLLKAEDLKKKPKKKQNPVKALNTPKSQNQNTNINVTNETKKTNTKGIKTLIFICLISIFYFVAPKPQLLTYEKMGITSQSIYWPGFYKYNAFILDSTLKANANIQSNNLFLCHDNIKNLPCQKYKITNIQGPFSAMMFLYKQSK